jgi:hypothetical protein
MDEAKVPEGEELSLDEAEALRMDALRELLREDVAEDELREIDARFRLLTMGKGDLTLSQEFRSAMANAACFLALAVEPTRERALAMTKMEEALMWGTRAIAQGRL